MGSGEEVSNPREETGLWSQFSPKGRSASDVAMDLSNHAPDTRMLEFATKLQEQLEDRGVDSVAAFRGDMLELGIAKNKAVFLRGPEAACIVLRLDLPNARRLSHELDGVPLGATSRSLVFAAIHQAMFSEAATTHHFEKGMRVEVVAGKYMGRRGNIGYAAALAQDDWVVYLDSPAGCKRPAVGRKRATRHFRVEELIPVEEEPTEGEPATPAGRSYYAAMYGWTDGAGRKPMRSGMADHPHLGAIYLDAYTRGQRAAREEADRVAAKFGYTPLVVKPCGGHVADGAGKT